MCARWQLFVFLIVSAYASVSLAELPNHAEIQTLHPIQPDIAADDSNFGLFVSFGSPVAMRSGVIAISMRAGDRIALYERRSTVWTRTTTLTPPEIARGFGSALALRDNTLVVGASDALYVYKQVNGVWRYRQKLTAPPGDNILRFTGSIKYQDNLVVAGATRANAPGAVYCFELSAAGALLKTTRLDARGGVMGNEFGADVAMSKSLIVVGAYGENDYRGAAYVFRRTSVGWRQSQRLSARDGVVGDRFGAAVAVNNGVIVIGAPQADPFGDFGETRGAAYVFFATNGAYRQSKRLQPSAVERSLYQQFGADIEMSLDRIAIAGSALYDEDRYPPAGHVITYRLSGTSVASIGVAQQDAEVASMSFDRNMLLLGVPFEWRCYDRNRCIGSATLFDVSRK